MPRAPCCSANSRNGIYGFVLAVIPRILLLIDKKCERLASLALTLSGGKIGLFSGNDGFFGAGASLAEAMCGSIREIS